MFLISRVSIGIGSLWAPFSRFCGGLPVGDAVLVQSVTVLIRKSLRQRIWGGASNVWLHPRRPRAERWRGHLRFITAPGWSACQESQATGLCPNVPFTTWGRVGVSALLSGLVCGGLVHRKECNFLTHARPERLFYMPACAGLIEFQSP